MVDEWIDRYGLTDTVEYISESTRAEGRDPGDLDIIYLPGEATPDQVNQLAAQLGRAYDLRVFVRRVEVIAIPTVERRTMRPTGDFMLVEVGLAERAKRRREPNSGGRDVN